MQKGGALTEPRTIVTQRFRLQSSFRIAGANPQEGDKQVAKTGGPARTQSPGALAAISEVKDWIAAHRPELIKANISYFGIAFHGMDGEEDPVDGIQTIGFDLLAPTDSSCVKEVRPLLIHLLRQLVPKDYCSGSGGGGSFKVFTLGGKIQLQSFYYSLKAIYNDDIVI